jgi:hypothetical protein
MVADVLSAFGEVIMRKLTLVSATALVGSLMALGVTTIPAGAFTAPVNFNEGASGIITAIPTASPTINVASDGEVPFFPFGATTDMSDAIQFTAGAGSWTWSGPANNWTTPDGGATWFLPAINENEPASEDIGRWFFTAGSGWNPETPSAVFLWESTGVLSDEILLANNGPGGAATITFISDPIVPEPSTWVMLALGFAGLGFAGYRTSRRSAPVAS